MDWDRVRVEEPLVRSAFYYVIVLLGTARISPHGWLYVFFNAAFAVLVFRGVEALVERLMPGNVPYVPFYFAIIAILRLSATLVVVGDFNATRTA